MTSLRRILPADPTLCVCGDRNCGIPWGYCHCRCGLKTPLSKQRFPNRNLYAGFPLRFINGHNAKKAVDAVEDEPPFFIDDEPCRWLPLSKGYFFIVDASRFEELMQWRWYAHLEPKSGKVYAVRHDGCVNGVRKPQVALHRHILSPRCGMTIDHKNGNSFDNRISNLRQATQRQQSINTRPNKGRMYKGVHFVTKCKAEITFHGESVYLGSYTDPKDGAIAYDYAARILFGDFAWLNFPDLVDYPEWTSGIEVKCRRALASSRFASK